MQINFLDEASASMGSLALTAFAALAGVGVMLLLIFREPRSTARHTLILFFGACVLERCMEAPAGRVLSSSAMAPIQQLRLLCIALQLGPLYHFSRVYSRAEPNSSPQARWPLVFVYLVPPVCVLAGWPIGANVIPLPGPESIEILRLGLCGVLLHVLAMMVAVRVLLTFEQTLRASIGTMRWRVKYMVLGLAAHGIVRIYLSSQEILFAGLLYSNLSAVGSTAFLVTATLVAFSLHRGHLQSVDIYPSQQVLRHSVTVMLAGLYLLIVGLLAYLARWIGGLDSLPFRSLLILAGIIGVAVILLSDRVRLWSKQVVAVHFRRPSYDYRLIWESVNQHASSQMDVPSFAQAAAQVISQTFEALSVSLWLWDEPRRRFALVGSTLIERSQGGQVAPPPAQTDAILDALLCMKQPVDLNQIQAPWAAAMLQAHPDSFRTGQTVCVPLRAREVTLGVLLLGDRVGYRPFLTEDYLLLQTLSDHLAARLLSIRLSQQLLEAKEFEAFQAMSTFFVHDLKNIASTLALLLRNFRRHVDKPAFRADALQTISDTVDKLNQTIEQLTLLRRRPELNLQPTPLSDVVQGVLDRLHSVLPQHIATRLGAPPPVSIDADQMAKVLTNLLLNARDACGADGHIEIETGVRTPWAFVTVRDDGPGMTPEFMEDSLFRAFHSTKKKGLGIGLFHSKHIVEAHHGRLEVESEPGRGAAFHVLLPIKETEGGNG